MIDGATYPSEAAVSWGRARAAAAAAAAAAGYELAGVALTLPLCSATPLSASSPKWNWDVLNSGSSAVCWLVMQLLMRLLMRSACPIPTIVEERQDERHAMSQMHRTLVISNHLTFTFLFIIEAVVKHPKARTKQSRKKTTAAIT